MTTIPAVTSADEEHRDGAAAEPRGELRCDARHHHARKRAMASGDDPSNRARVCVRSGASFQGENSG
jgi:hypothetical protein